LLLKFVKVDNPFSPNKIKVYLISIAHLVHDSYTSFLPPVLPILIRNFSLTYTHAGLLQVALRIPSLFNPLIGHISDRTEVKYFIALSPMLTAIAMSLLGVAPGYWYVFILLLITGFSSSFFHVPSPVVLKRLSQNRLGASMSCFQIGGELSRTIGPLIIIGAISLWGFDGTYRLIPAGLIISMILLFILKDEHISHSNPEKTNFKDTLVTTFKQGKYLFIAITGLLLTKSFIASVVAAFLPTYLRSKGHSLWLAGGTYSLLQAGALLGVSLTGTISDKLDRKKLVILLAFASPVRVYAYFFKKCRQFPYSYGYISRLRFFFKYARRTGFDTGKRL